MTDLRPLIPEVLGRFDFRRVHKVMTFLNWTWVDSLTVPSVLDLEIEATSQLSKCVSLWEQHGKPESGMLVASGGFQATITCYTKGQPNLGLTFYVEDAEARHWR